MKLILLNISLWVAFFVFCFFIHQDYLKHKEAHEQEINRIKARISYLDKQEKELKEKRKRYSYCTCDDWDKWILINDLNDIDRNLFLCLCGK